ncbi:MAG TPA: glycosyltransferase [Burkholderiales bacterium]|jgi:cellulose synthase/poly-beta-1,6-N-acetylglucosamine synthase-like glycosyltransferase|nr:glycosyltransferase [Burkholderiales bacterium]
MFWLAVLTFAVVTAAMLVLVRGNRSIRFLRDLSADLPSSTPRVSLIVAARNEERNIEAALSSLLAQDYPDYEVIVVDDRSSDLTPEILARAASLNPGMQVVRIDALPSGWLGKNHALDRGAAKASGEFLIFADADVMMRADAVRRAVGHALACSRDHIAITPHMISPGVMLGMFMSAFTMFFSLYARPWKAPDPRSRCFIGIGAFNLVRASVYRAVGGHARIAMRPDDDIKLGKILKDAGYSQEMLFGRDVIGVEWYPSVRALAQGLEKNTLAGVDYSVAAIVASALGQSIVFVWPFLALLCTSGAVLALNAMICMLLLFACVDQTRFVGVPPIRAAGLPVATVLFMWILLRATYVTLRNDGIDWRGTHYPLAALKANRV